MLQLFADLASSGTTYQYNYGTTPSASAGAAGAVLVIYGIVWLVSWFIGGFILSRVFKKAGRSAVAAYIPIWQTWELFELGGKSGANFFWIFLPIAGPIVFLVMYIQAMLEVARRFGKSGVFAIFGLVFFSLIGWIILAFDSSTYMGASQPGVQPGGVDMGPMPAMPPQQPAAPMGDQTAYAAPTAPIEPVQPQVAQVPQPQAPAPEVPQVPQDPTQQPPVQPNGPVVG